MYVCIVSICMYACLCVHGQDSRGRTLSNEFIIVKVIVRESYGMQDKEFVTFGGLSNEKES